MPQVVVHKGKKLVRRVPLHGEVVTIGRGGVSERDEPDILLPDTGRTASRYHAAIIMADRGGHFVRDLGSTNGTRLNGKIVYRAVLSDGDVISIGDFSLHYSVDDLDTAEIPLVLIEDAPPDPVASDSSITLPLYLVDADARNLPAETRQVLNDVLQRWLVMAESPGFHSELVELAARTVAARRGLILSICRDGTVVTLSSHGIDQERGEQVRLNRRTFRRAIDESEPILAQTASDRSELYVPLRLGDDITRLLYLEAATSEPFEQNHLIVLRALVARLESVFAGDRGPLPGDSGEHHGRRSLRWKARVIGNCGLTRDLRKHIRTWACREDSILILGATGTGKGVAARAIHEASPRNRGPFRVVELPAKSPQVIESELFGHEKGAFTGAVTARAGAFEEARGGTLFLDEIGDVSLAVQGKLRRAIEKKEIYRMGSTRPIQVDVRIISATNKDLLGEVHRNQFRRDLYERLGPTIKVPTLAARKEDIPLLLHYFVDELDSNLAGLAHSVIQMLLHYHWPGNIRELKRLVSVFAASGRDVVFGWDLPADMQPVDGDTTKPKGATDGGPLLDQIEREAIRSVLARHRGNKTLAAATLGMSRPTLYKKIEKYDIQPPVGG